MGLLSSGLLWTLVALTVGLPLFAVVLWNRVPGPTAVRVAGRISLVAVCQLSAVALTFAYVNGQYAFYVSWGDLVGVPGQGGTIVALTGGGLALPSGQSRVLPGGSRELDLRVRGEASGYTGAVRVYLPAGYDDPANAQRRYPVVELLGGYHSNPQTWDTAFDLPGVLAPLEANGSVRPFIGVAPQVDIAGQRDLECTNVPHGPQAESWLGPDVRQLVTSRFRAEPARGAWGIVGYSSGGYCAVKLLLHHPTWYHSVVAMGSAFTALRDGTTGDLWGHDPLRRKLNDVVFLLRHNVHPDADLLVFTSRQDVESYHPTLLLLHNVLPPLRTSSLIVDGGGHNLRSLVTQLPAMLVWLSQHLSDGPDPADPNRRRDCPFCLPVLPKKG